MESCNEKNMYKCELEGNETKRKKKQKEKHTYCPDAQEKEVEAGRKDMTVWEPPMETFHMLRTSVTR
jgi:hypothetical protein